jgi:hypothetical protein
MKFAAITLLSLLFALVVGAQTSNFEYGKPQELKGLTKVFVDTGGDMKNYERITSEIEKAQLPGLMLLDSPNGAEIVLLFKQNIETTISATSRPIYGTSVTRTDVDEQKMLAGEGLVFIPKEDRRRVLLSFSDVQRAFEKKPAVNFAKTFLKAYRKANGLK